MMIDPAPEEIEVPHIISEGRGRHGAGTDVMICQCFLLGGASN